MKKVLSLLVAFTFMQVQTWALVGGPFDGSTGSASLVGSYAGIMVGTIPPGGVGAPGGAGLGIFTIGLPEGGIGTGLFAVYSGGQTIAGDVIGLGNPNEGTISGVMSGTYIPTFDAGPVIIIGLSQTTFGAQFEAEVESGGRYTSSFNAPLTGTAGATITYLDVFGASTTVNTDFVLTGYKQSSDATLATSVSIPFGGE